MVCSSQRSAALIVRGLRHRRLPVSNIEREAKRVGRKHCGLFSNVPTPRKALATVLGCQASAGLLLSGVRGALHFVQKHFLNREPDVSTASG